MRTSLRIFRIAILVLVGAACGIGFATLDNGSTAAVEMRQICYVLFGVFCGLAAELLFRQREQP
jgi:hypothetical protein